MSTERAQLALALAACAVAFGPFLFGLGVDAPDDAVYYMVSAWEWMRHAWTSDASLWWVPGKLGGVSLYADVIPMGPVYPAAWLLLLLPAWLALPLVAALHSLGSLLAVRWAARVHGASAWAATAVGAAVAAGPLGAHTFIDCHMDTIPLYVWFPLLLGAQERLANASGRERARWLAVCAAALGMLLLGSHLRWASGAAAAWGLMCVLRWRQMGWWAAIGVLGLAAGAPGFLPNVLQLPEVGGQVSRLVALTAPSHESYGLWNLAGWLAPKTFWYERDFSLGGLAGLGFLLGLARTEAPLRRQALFAGLLLLAAMSAGVPGLRWVFAPLVLLTHPLNLFYAALALFPAAIVAAGGLDLAAEGWPRVREALRGPVGKALVFVGLAMIARAVAGSSAFGTRAQWVGYLASLGQLALVSGAAVLVLRSGRSGAWIRWALLVLLIVDGAVLGLRFHAAAPSPPLHLRGRADVPDLEELRAGYADLTDLTELLGFLYDEQSLFDPPEDDSERDAERIGQELSQRRYPVHLGLAHGIPGLAGHARLPSRRALALPSLLSEALVLDGGGQDYRRVEDVEPARLAALFAGRGLGTRVLRRLGIPVAVGRAGVVARVDDLAPRCWAPRRFEVVSDLSRLRKRVAGTAFDPSQALLEAPLPGGPVERGDVVLRCPEGDEGSLSVTAERPAVIVLRQRHHPGWHLELESGAALPTFPVDLVHLGAVVPAGEHVVRARFVPPGLIPSLWLCALGWLAIVGIRVRS